MASDVDLLLVIALDVSSSVTQAEFELQREGFARALESPQVAGAIAGGAHRALAISVVQWSGFSEQILKIDWVVVSNTASLIGLAGKVREMTRRYKGGATDIGGTIDFCQELLVKAPHKGKRQVIDISGDGINNVNESPHIKRDRAIEAGTVVNGLAIATRLPDLPAYYRDRVAGGHGSFVETALDSEDFENAMRRKLVREITQQYLF